MLRRAIWVNITNQLRCFEQGGQTARDSKHLKADIAEGAGGNIGYSKEAQVQDFEVLTGDRQIGNWTPSCSTALEDVFKDVLQDFVYTNAMVHCN